QPLNNIFSIPDQFIDEAIDVLYLFNGSLVNIGVCIPSTCHPLDVETAINHILYPLIQMPVRIGPICDRKDKPIALDRYQMTAILIMSILFVLTILSAIYEYYINRPELPIDMNRKNTNTDNNKQTILSQIIVSFSIVANTKSLFRKSAKNGGKFNYIKYVVNMYLRFYPSILGVILMYYLLPLVGSGPFWHTADTQYVESCRKYLWPNLLSYNYYVLDLEEFFHSSMCNLASWWATTCFHLLLLAPLFIIPFYKSTNIIYFNLFLTVLGGVVSIGHIFVKGIPRETLPVLVADKLGFRRDYQFWWQNMSNYIMDYIPGSHCLELSLDATTYEKRYNTGRAAFLNQESFYSIFYTWPFIHHISPFAMGIITGYLIRKHPAINFGGRICQTILWIIFPALTVWSFHWTQQLMKSDISVETFTINEVSTELEVYLNLTFALVEQLTNFVFNTSVTIILAYILGFTCVLTYNPIIRFTMNAMNGIHIMMATVRRAHKDVKQVMNY
ncbi:unnamed protein product, partial [Medioppia subpectinata]